MGTGEGWGFSLGKGKLWEDFTVAFQCLKEVTGKLGGTLLSGVW